MQISEISPIPYDSWLTSSDPLLKTAITSLIDTYGGYFCGQKADRKTKNQIKKLTIIIFRQSGFSDMAVVEEAIRILAQCNYKVTPTKSAHSIRDDEFAALCDYQNRFRNQIESSDLLG